MMKSSACTLDRAAYRSQCMEGAFVKSAGRRVTVLLVAGKVLFGVAAFIVSVLWTINLGAKPITKPDNLPANLTASIDETKLDSAEVMLKNIETMNAFGSRTTGSEGHNSFIAWLEQQVTDRGLTVYRNSYTFDRWEEKKSAILIDKLLWFFLVFHH
ncbi:hypothetical protein [Paenibacillus sp. NPDC058071]|uniref:hypothetical protein n=1 Tax=Paenibacillus sp. NPDC058071 TaxID=3346326 RepID=UPI0036DFA394